MTWFGAGAIAVWLGIRSLRVVVSAAWLHSVLQRLLQPSASSARSAKVAETMVGFLERGGSLRVDWKTAGLPDDELRDETVRHLDEVRRLLHRLWGVGELIGLASVLLALRSPDTTIRRAGLVSSIAGAAGVLTTTVGFSVVWTWYHRIAYDNEDWQLPDSAMLAMLYSERFYRAAGTIWFGLWLVSGIALILWKRPAHVLTPESRSPW